jgi:hypothetical protein
MSECLGVSGYVASVSGYIKCDCHSACSLVCCAAATRTILLFPQSIRVDIANYQPFSLVKSLSCNMLSSCFARSIAFCLVIFPLKRFFCLLIFPLKRFGTLSPNILTTVFLCFGLPLLSVGITAEYDTPVGIFARYGFLIVPRPTIGTST